MEDLVNFCDQRCQDGKNKCVGAEIPTKGYRRKKHTNAVITLFSVPQLEETK